ncbi:Tetranectin [Fukomys damarensis]|uniref:Tetranectin n=1 Tax=Fukomys damarensis TaxID=885580 RepID=A0A091DS44_FUKDA|nr:Tetranectin [Fukomys damarensis]
MSRRMQGEFAASGTLGLATHVNSSLQNPRAGGIPEDSGGPAVGIELRVPLLGAKAERTGPGCEREREITEALPGIGRRRTPCRQCGPCCAGLSTASCPGGDSSSSMELRGPQLLLCVLALLTQVAAEVPTSKPKKVVNARKDIVSPKTIEELKSRLDALAQEVVVLKEQQALQTEPPDHQAFPCSLQGSVSSEVPASAENAFSDLSCTGYPEDPESMAAARSPGSGFSRQCGI